jgi:hypothetical protein
MLRMLRLGWVRAALVVAQMWPSPALVVALINEVTSPTQEEVSP